MSPRCPGSDRPASSDSVLAEFGHEVPWHRVVLADGAIATPDSSSQRRLLRAEGVTIGPTRNGRIDMKTARWDPPTTPPTDAATDLAWVGRSQSAKGVRQRRFDLTSDGRVIPGLLWTPVGAKGPRPLVLIGHGAANTKSEPYVMSMARRFVRHHKFAAVAIDGPVHGDRRRDGSLDGAVMFLEFAQRWANDPDVTRNMAADWRATIDVIQTLPEIGQCPVGWWGLSMGTIFGLPVVASDRRVTAAVLGCMGTGGPSDAVRDQVVADAHAIECPVLFLMQWDDHIFSRAACLDLFDTLGSTDKRLHVHPGAHASVPAEELDVSESFLASLLSA